MSFSQLTSDFHFDFPDELIATAPLYPPRVLRSHQIHGCSQADEISWQESLKEFKAGDLLVRNNSKVVPRRIFAGDLEILMLRCVDELIWEVLYPAKKNKVGDILQLPGGVHAKLLQKGLPQLLEVSRPLDASYFFEFGELPLPPYIQAARESRHHLTEDQRWYQTCFAQKEGSLAAPTAGLHFKSQDFALLEAQGVEIVDVTLHVGLGTFLPIQTQLIDDFQIHAEHFEVTQKNLNRLRRAKQEGRSISTLGTTATRVVESISRIPYDEGSLQTLPIDPKTPVKIKETADLMFGETQIYLRKAEDFLWTNRILTNFHQPQTSLLVMICAFAGYDHVMSAYKRAVENKFRLFSYGDFSIWNR